MNEELNRRLRAAAEAHQPDRARILARVERGTTGAPARRRAPSGTRPWPRVALASLAAAGMVAVGGFAVAAIVKAPPARPEVSATPPAPPAPGTPHPKASAPATAPASPPPRRSSPASPGPSASGSAGTARPDGAHVQDGPLWSAGAVHPDDNIYWAQSDITLKTTQPLTSLTVELRVAQTGAVQSTGNWRTLPAEDFAVTVAAQPGGGAVVYRWVLKPGRMVPAGEHVFAGQYDHSAGDRSAAHDGYRIDANGPRGAASVWGGFLPGT
ncbi:hypothetical protein [Streptomyces sp. NPDC091268]|uniref:hypothetical protein n=1 Tax=Streptomyces sp. NPDC091268 TaxID=3365979 RepID=UPI0037F47BE7